MCPTLVVSFNPFVFHGVLYCSYRKYSSILELDGHCAQRRDCVCTMCLFFPSVVAASSVACFDSPGAHVPAGKLGGRDIELRCPFPPPGRAVAGADLNEITVEGIGLAPRGRVMVQFRYGLFVSH